MHYVDGRSMVVMDSVTDRMRLKDKIVANVAKAVKSIQELHILSGRDTITLGNFDWQCHRLCEHLDHTLLHGLRHVTPGYWKIVTEFTHKDCIKEIKRMRNVTTDLGRGRAWLFMALNECLLESYLRCYQQNDSLVEDYYVKDALVRDQDKFDVLLTLTSGLESTIFEMDCDVPYLDLCVYPPKSRHSANREASIEFDKLSVCSMESLHVQASKPLPQTVFEAQDSYKPADTSSTGSGDSYIRRHSPSLDSGVHSDWNYRQRSITPIDQLGGCEEASQDSTAMMTSELEVIRLTKKGKPQKHKKKKKRFVSLSSVTDPDVPLDIPEDHKGPVVEIPPLDDFKLNNAIKDSKNNNDTDLPGYSLHDTDSSWSSDLRSPGDGTEHADDVDGSVNKSRLRTGSKLLEDKHKESSENADTASASASSYRDSGIFTEMIKARVSNIVDAGEKVENDSVKSDGLSNENRDVIDSSHDSVQFNLYDLPNDDDSINDSFLAKSQTSVYETSELYNGESIDNLTVKPESKELKKQVNEDVEEVPEEPSIYSTGCDSDACNSDNDLDMEGNSIFQKNMHSNNPSRQSINSSRPPSRKSTATPTSLGFSESSQSISTDVIETDAKQKPANHVPDVIYSTNHDSDMSETEHLSNRNTPEFFNRKSSVSSKSSMDEMEYKNLPANLPFYKLTPRQSPNQLSSYRNSPNQSTDDDRVSNRSRCSNKSTDSDQQVSEGILQAKVEELIVKRTLNAYTHLTFEEEDGEEEVVPEIVRDRTSSLTAGEVELDNNSMLFLMLDILEGEETMVKMFCCRQGHTEGKTKTVFILISTHSLHVLQHLSAKKRFQKSATIPFTDIDFVSLGFDSQILHIACKNKRQKYWFTTGDERITVALVDCLADSMENSDSKPGRLEVDTGNTAQKISLQKYISKECRCESDEAVVMSYSLVHWEDPASRTGSCEHDREGNLYYKSYETANILGTQSWRIAYAVLKDCMLCLYNDKSDSKPTHFLSMGGDQCVGCKRDFNSDKNHSVKIVLADGSYWSLALESENEANQWIQGLCHAVSEGLQMNPERASCVPCCMVLSRQKLLMCHEDPETNFLRTLGSASLEDVTAILVNELNNTFLVLAFDSPEETVSSEKWVLYFNSEHESARFQKSLSESWYNHYQIEIPVLPLDDFALQKKSRDMANYLKNTVSLC